MSSSQSERREHRRRILKAAAGVPVVLTLPSGAAMAAVSVACDANSQAIYEAEGAVKFPQEPDKWMRVKLAKLEFRMRDSPARWSTVEGFEFNGAWYKVEGDAAEEVTQFVSPHDMTDRRKKVVEGQYYYGLVDYQDGAGVLLLNQEDPNILPIAGASCWNSLTGSTLTSNVIDAA